MGEKKRKGEDREEGCAVQAIGGREGGRGHVFSKGGRAGKRGDEGETIEGRGGWRRRRNGVQCRHAVGAGGGEDTSRARQEGGGGERGGRMSQTGGVGERRGGEGGVSNAGRRYRG